MSTLSVLEAARETAEGIASDVGVFLTDASPVVETGYTPGFRRLMYETNK